MERAEKKSNVITAEAMDYVCAVRAADMAINDVSIAAGMESMARLHLEPVPYAMGPEQMSAAGATLMDMMSVRSVMAMV